MSKTTIFTVTGMTCDNCVHHVTEAVKGVTGVTDVDVSLKKKSATVQGDFDAVAVIAAIEEEGYDAKVAG